MVKVALVYNLLHPEMLKKGPLDLVAELDTEETISALLAALRSGGHEPVPLEADEAIAENLRSAKPDIVFNIAEGLRGESRESHVPAICEMLGLPYTGSGPLCLSTCLDKGRTKEVLTYYHIPTARFQVLESTDDKLDPSLRFPLIIKLLAEGSGMGLSADSVVDDETALKARAKYLFDNYHEAAIVEEFIEGREFTVGVLGNTKLEVLPIIEVIFKDRRGITLPSPDEWVVPLIQQVRGAESLPPEPDYHSVCPAPVDEELAERIRNTAMSSYKVLKCRDWCRMEMRLGLDGNLYTLELNPIAGIDPTYWLPKAARAAGLSYDALVNKILDYAMERVGLGAAVSKASD